MKKRLLIAWVLFFITNTFWFFWSEGIYGTDVKQVIFTEVYALVSNLIIIAIAFDLFSIATVLTFILFTVALVPGAALLFGSPLYSFHNIKHQLDAETTIYTVQLYYWASFVCTLVLLFLKTISIDYKNRAKTSVALSFPFFVSTFLFVVFTYLAEPGPTLLSANYDELLNSRNETETATMAGILMSVFWMISYLHYRRYTFEKVEKIRQMVFIAATVFTMLWLYLHARRSEMVGIVIVLFVHQKYVKGRIKIVHLASAFSVVFLMYIL